MLQLNNVEVMYDHVIQVLKGVSLEVATGSIVCLLGANGAGKTTTLKAISGLLKEEKGEVSDGSIEFDESGIDHLSAEDIVKMGVSQIMEGRRIFVHLTVDENLRAASFLRKNKQQTRLDLDRVFTYFPALGALRKQTAGYLSGGEQQMLAIGRGLVARPKLMLLDEPSLGLAPILVKEIFEIVERINQEEGVGILLVEQNARAALDVATYGYVMENGRIVMDGPAEDLKANQDIQEFYLGLSELGDRKHFKDVKHYRRRKRWVN